MDNSTIWYAGICDSMLRKVDFWRRTWSQGSVYATRPKMEADGRMVEIPTMRSVPVAWQPKEMAHLVRILKALRPKWEITADLENLGKVLHKCPLQPGGARLAHMHSYEKDPQEILEVLLQARSGKDTFEEEMAKAVDKGQSIFDVS